MGSRAVKYLGRFCPADLPQYYLRGTPPPPPSYKKYSGTAAGFPKIFYNITPISTSTPCIDINHPLLASIPQELGNLADSLAEWAKEVGFYQTCTEVCGSP